MGGWDLCWVLCVHSVMLWVSDGLRWSEISVAGDGIDVIMMVWSLYSYNAWGIFSKLPLVQCRIKMMMSIRPRG